MMEKKTKKEIKKIKKKFNGHGLKIAVILGFLILVIAFISVNAWQIYGLNSQSVFTEKVSKVIPYPAARVNNEFISYYDFLKNFAAANKFYQKQGINNLAVSDLQKFVLEDRLINNVLVREIAKDYKISVSQKEIDQEIDLIIQNKGSQKEFAKFLADFYDLSIRDYKEYFTKPNLYYDKTNDVIIDDELLNGQAKKDIQAALNRLRNQENFYELIKEYDGVENQQIARGDLPAGIEDELFSMTEGEYTDVVNLAGSYQIIKLEKKDSDKGILTLSFIIVKTVNIDDLLKEHRAKADIEIYIY